MTPSRHAVIGGLLTAFIGVVAYTQTTSADLQVASVAPRISGGLHLPPLSDARVLPEGGSNSGSDHFASETRLLTRRSSAELADHYTRLLEASGWRRTTSWEQPDVHVLWFDGRAKNGMPAAATMVVFALGPEQRVVRLRIAAQRSTLARRQAPVASPAGSPGRQGGRGASANGAAPSRSLPHDFPVDLLPPGTVVVTTATAGTTTRVRGTIVRFGAGEFARFAQALRERRWQNRRPPQRGFTKDWGSLELCRDGVSALVDLVPSTSGDAAVFAEVSAAGSPAPCAAGFVVRAFPDAPLPLLMAPNGANQAGTSSGGGLTTFHSDTRVATSLPLMSLGDAYADQIGRAGWQVAAAHTTPTTLVRRFARVLPSGERLDGLLVLRTMSDGTVDASLTVHRPART
jgi:hypothetical protein